MIVIFKIKHVFFKIKHTLLLQYKSDKKRYYRSNACYPSDKMDGKCWVVNLGTQKVSIK